MNFLNKEVMRLGVAIVTILLVTITVYICLTQTFKVTTYEIETEKQVTDLRIVFVSDLHLKEYGKDNSRLLKKIEDLKPSLIAVVGDSIIYNVDDHDSAINFLNRAAKIAPTYFSAGNHEWSQLFDKQSSTLYNDLMNCDALFLDNELCTLNVNGEDIIICGVYDSADAKYITTNSILTELNSNKNKNMFKLLMSHCPMTISNTQVTPQADLVLSGHEHGGQIIIPFTKQGLFSRSQGWFPKYTQGIHEIAGNKVIISTGLSNSDLVIPRINNMPELVVIDVNKQ